MTGPEFSGVDIGLLADYVGGALDGTPEADAVAALIRDDQAWQATHEQLSQGMAWIGAELHDLGNHPEPMPADLVARLTTAFAPPTTAAPGTDPQTSPTAGPHATVPAVEPAMSGTAAGDPLAGAQAAAAAGSAAAAERAATVARLANAVARPDGDPGVVAPEAEAPNAEKTDTPESGKPGAARPAFAKPAAATPEAATPETATPETATPETATPETATPEAATPEAATPEAATSDAAASDVGATAPGPDAAGRRGSGPGGGGDAADPAPIDPELAAPTVPHVVTSGRRRAGVPAGGVDLGVTGPGRRGAKGERRRRLRRSAPIATVIAALLAFGAIGVGRLLDPSSLNSASPNSASGESLADRGAGSLWRDSPPPSGTLTATGNNYGPDSLDAASQGQADGAFQSFESIAPAPGGDGPRVAPPLENAPDQPEPFMGSAAAKAPLAFPLGIAAGLRRLATDDALTACLQTIEAENGAGPMVRWNADYALYRSTPALVVRFEAANGTWVWAVGAQCGAPDIGAALLHRVKVG